MTDSATISQALARARRSAARGEDESAKHSYVYVLHFDPTNFAALNELAVLASASGHRSAARTAWLQAVRYHPGNPIGHINLANLLLEDGDDETARTHYLAALASDPDMAEAHQGLARLLAARGDPAADAHRRKGYDGHAVVVRPYRGTGEAIPLLLLVSALGGNIPTRAWIDDRSFEVTAVHTDHYEPVQNLPRPALVVNAIGDADLCTDALARAEAMLAQNAAPVINPPALVRQTGRAANARRLAAIPGVIAPKITLVPIATIEAAVALPFPLLLRSPGFHTGQHFLRVETQDGLADAARRLPGETVLAIQYLDARGPDGMARKYRVMFIDRVPYPLHLAISRHWKVHYFTAAMAADPAFRDEERRFLQDMPAVLGPRAMAALDAIAATLALDYAGADFALAPDGSVLLFEANATMVVAPPDPDPMWDYRRPAIEAVLTAVRRMLLSRL